MRYTVNYGSAKEPDLVEMVQTASHEAVRADFAAVSGLREWGPEISASEPRKAAPKRRKAA